MFTLRIRQLAETKCGCSSVVECLLAKEKVTGANPVTRSIYGEPAESIARSSNGRTAAFEAVNDGSIPSLAATNHSLSLGFIAAKFSWR